MNFALLLDTETTGLEPATDRILELAVAVLWWEGPTWRIAECYSGIGWTSETELTPEIIALTGLVPEIGHGRAIRSGHVKALASACKAVVAWNAPFDRSFCDAAGLVFPGLVWADAQRHLDWGRVPSKSLVTVAAVNRVLNPCPHSAMGDVLTMAALIGPRMDELLARAVMPEVEVRAIGARFEAKDALKARGYQWQPDAKVWTRTVTEPEAAAEVAWLSAETGARPVVGPTK